jgi:NAD(P)H-flavin reductase
MHEWHDGKVLSLTNAAKGLDHLVVSVPETLTAAYTTAGQYTRLMVQGRSAGIYALASSPGPGAPFEYLVKNDGSVVNAIASLTADTALKISEPLGHGFPLEQVGTRPLWLLGTGSGLAPLRAVVRALLNKHERPAKVTLLYGARNEVHVPFANEFSDWEKRGIDVRLTFSQPPPGWKGLRGYVQAHVSDIGRDDGVVFLCGQKHMVEEAGRMLALVGVGKERIFLNV